MLDPEDFISPVLWINIGPKSAKYDFNDINFLGRLVLKDSYFVEFEHSNMKHSSLNKKHTIKPYWTKVGYQFSLGNDNENDLLC